MTLYTHFRYVVIASSGNGNGNGNGREWVQQESLPHSTLHASKSQIFPVLQLSNDW